VQNPHNAYNKKNILQSPDLVLIDDDPTLRESWEIVATLNNIKFKAFDTAKNFLTHINFITKTTPIYIDYHLDSHQSGIDFAKKLYEQGFSQIYLSTGFEPSEFDNYPWVKKIVGKEFPFNLE